MNLVITVASSTLETNLDSLAVTPLEALRQVWRQSASGLAALVVHLERGSWFLSGDSVSAWLPEWPLELTGRDASRSSYLLDRSELTDGTSMRLARFFGFSDDRLARLGDGPREGDLEARILLGDLSPLVEEYRHATATVSPRWSQFSPLFHLLALLAETVEPGLLLTEVEAWKASLTERSPLWLRCRLLKASSALHHLGGDLGRASFEEDLIRSYLAKLPSDPVIASLLGERVTIPRGSRDPIWPAATLSGQIELRCLGSPLVSYDEKLVAGKSWRTQKAMSLFFYLALEGRALSADHLQEVIWPGLGYESGPNFLTTLSRVRKALASVGLAKALVRRQGRLYQLDPGYTVRTDKDEFETRARAVGGKSFALDEAQAALSLYEGPFLDGLDDLWVMQVRRPLQELWFELAIRTAEAELTRGEAERAYHLCGRMLKLEGAREEAHLCRIKTLFAMGRVSDAQDAYQGFEKLLKRSTGQGVSADVQAQYWALRQGARSTTRG